MQVGQCLQSLDQQAHFCVLALVLARDDDRARVFEQVHGVKGLPRLIKAIVQHADDVGMVERSQRPELLGQGQRGIGVPTARGKGQLIGG